MKVQLKVRTHINAGLCYSHYIVNPDGAITPTDDSSAAGAERYGKRECEANQGGGWWTAGKKCCF